MSEQKFQCGDYVRVIDNHHYHKDEEGIVVGSYCDQFGGNNTEDYTLFIKDKGESSWYEESSLVLIESHCNGLLEEWKQARDADNKIKSDLDWIFSHSIEVLENKYGASVQALASCFGLMDLWGKNGEGFVYYENSVITLALAKDYLKNGDKEGWLKRAEEIKENLKENSR